MTGIATPSRNTPTPSIGEPVMYDVNKRSFAAVPIRTVANGRAVPLSIEPGCNTETDMRYMHCEIAKQYGHPILVGAGPHISTEPCHIVGSGLSAIKALPEIKAAYKRGEEIVALKGAHDWLIKNGVIPRAAIAMDAQQSRAKCFRRRQKDVLYLCASQMHPDTWEYMEGYKVLVWHARISTSQHLRADWSGDYIITVASCTGNSALILMYVMGRRNLHTWGLDSCVAQPRWWNRFVKPLMKLDGARVDRNMRKVTIDGQFYWSTPELVMQVQEVKALCEMLEGATIQPHGDGYYQAVIRHGKALGWEI